MENEIKLSELINILTTKQKITIILDTADEEVFKGYLHLLLESPLLQTLENQEVFKIKTKGDMLIVVLF